MKPAPRRWEISSAVPLSGYHPVIGQVLAARGYDDAAAAELMSGEHIHHDPFELKGMTSAVHTITAAMNAGERIAIYGDYDVDGVTACALLTIALRSVGADVVSYIPNRMVEGYGLHEAALAELSAAGVTCVVTVDCGTSSVDVAQSRPSGMKLVITDHHLPRAPDGTPPALAPADALINPKQPDCSYPFDALAGAGVAWKLLQALESEGVVPPGTSDSLIGFAALGTVADMMPLRGENRVIVQRGLASWDVNAPAGIRALCEVAGVRGNLRASDFAFSLGPRINAAGRMEDAELALKLCLSTSFEEAQQYALALNTQNVTRQHAVALAFAQAEARMSEVPDDAPAIALGDPEWPMGIVGLVAGRLMEKYARPTFIASLDPTEAKGSARSIRGVHIVRALDGAADTLIRYGGHAVAAGFSLEAQRFPEFAERIAAAVALQLEDVPRERVFTVDALLTGRDLTAELCRELDVLEPCGQGNHHPLFAMLDCEVLATKAFGAQRQHVRVTVRHDGVIADAIAFHKPELASHLPRGRRIDVCCGVELDTWNGREQVRLRLRDLRPAVPNASPVELSGHPLETGVADVIAS